MKMNCTECGQEFDRPQGNEEIVCGVCYDKLHPEEDIATCPVCDAEMEWIECDMCEDGMIDEAEDDPINFAPGEELTPCHHCDGNGGWLECTRLPHTKEQLDLWEQSPTA
jgi:hypothetical protein